MPSTITLMWPMVSVMGPEKTRKGREVTMPGRRGGCRRFRWRCQTYGDGPAHGQLAGTQVVQEPEEEGLDESPEDAGKHHHQEEHDDLEGKEGQEVCEHTSELVTICRTLARILSPGCLKSSLEDER